MSARGRRGSTRMAVALAAAASILAAGFAQAPSLGRFEASTDIGRARHGSAVYDASTGVYRVTGGGDNMWFNNDAFQFAWRKAPGNLTIGADVQFSGAAGNPHRKAVLMIRQSLDPDAAYVDVAVHGSGLTSLQFRRTAGAMTEEVQAPGDWFRSPGPGPANKVGRSIRLERRGDQFVMYAGNAGGPLQASKPVSVVLKNPVYVGIGVCSHDASTVETATFSHLKIQ